MMDKLCKLSQMHITESDCISTGPDLIPAFSRFLVSHWTRFVEFETFQFLKAVVFNEDCIPIPRTGKLLTLLFKTDTADWNTWELYVRLLFVRLLLTNKITGPEKYRWDLS